MSLFGRSLADGDRLEVAGATVRLKVHRRARRISLRLDRTRREIIATAPSQRRLPEAAAFAHDRASWIVERLAELPQSQAVAPGMTITLFGEPCRLEASDR
ncbi:MAG TPA: metal-dependent hydrolase, partial [Phenylobacterium sp.]